MALKKNPHEGHRARLRKQVEENGLFSLQEHQALEFLLHGLIPYKDTNVIAHNLIDRFGSFANVFEADKRALMEINGIGEKVASFITTFTDIFYYYQQSRDSRDICMKQLGSALDFARQVVANKNHEEFYVLLVDSQGRVVTRQCISQGNDVSADVKIGKICSFLLSNKYSNFFVVHNHPGGKPTPSYEDDRLTRAIIYATEFSGFYLQDHIIVGKNEVFSYKSARRLEEYRGECYRLINKQDALLNSEVQGKYSEGEETDEKLLQE